jgi:hypothetical protein
LGAPRLGKGFVQPVPGKQRQAVGKTEKDIHFVGSHRFDQGSGFGSPGGGRGRGKRTIGSEPGGVFGKNVVDPLALVILDSPVFVLGYQGENSYTTFVKGIHRPAPFSGPSFVGGHRLLGENGEAPQGGKPLIFGDPQGSISQEGILGVYDPIHGTFDVP